MTTQRAATKSSAGHSRSERRVGYCFAIAINAAMLWLVNGWPGWEAVPFLTQDTIDVIPLVNASIAAAIAVNVVYFVADPPWLRALGDVLVTAMGIVALVAWWRVFPFEFSGQTFDWELAVRVLLVLAMAGSAIAVVAGLVRLAAGGRQTRQTQATRRG
jgi:hypothetical protein